MGYELPPTKRWVDKEYRTPNEIEAELLGHLDALLTAWEGEGLPVETVVCAINRIMEGGGYLLSKITDPGRRDSEYDSARETLAKSIRPAFLSESSGDKERGAIHSLHERAGSGGMSPFAIARAILDLIAQNPLPEKSPLHTLHNDIRKFETRLEKQRTTRPVTGSLAPEPEAFRKQLLDPYLKRMTKSAPAGEEFLIDSMQADAMGSGMIAVFHDNPDYRRTKRGGGAKRSVRLSAKFDPYDLYEDYVQGLYGTTCARVTTYSISFTPGRPQEIEAVRTAVQQAVNLIGKIPPAFGIPTDSFAEPYARPYSPHARWDYAPNKEVPANTGVRIVDGKVVVETRLDLDDTYNLYYLLEHLIRPGVETARALNTARFVEARSAPMQKAEMNGGYGTENNDDPSLRVGDLSEHPNDPLAEAITAARTLHATGQIGDDGLLAQAATIAAATLQREIGSPSGALPPAQAMLSVADGETEMTPELMQTFWRRRTVEIMRLIAGGVSSSEDIAPTLALNSSKIDEIVRNRWRKKVTEEDSRRQREIMRLGRKEIFRTCTLYGGLSSGNKVRPWRQGGALLFLCVFISLFPCSKVFASDSKFSSSEVFMFRDSLLSKGISVENVYNTVDGKESIIKPIYILHRERLTNSLFYNDFRLWCEDILCSLKLVKIRGFQAWWKNIETDSGSHPKIISGGLPGVFNDNFDHWFLPNFNIGCTGFCEQAIGSKLPFSGIFSAFDQLAGAPPEQSSEKNQKDGGSLVSQRSEQ